MGGIRLIMDKCAELIAAKVPKSEASRPFNLAEDSGAWTPGIIRQPSTATTRLFVIRPPDTMPSDDGEAGTPAGRLTQILHVKVVYLFRDVDTVRAFELAMEDCWSIQAALQQPILWDCVNTGIDSIAPAQAPYREALDQGDKTVGFELIIPVPVTYREVSP